MLGIAIGFCFAYLLFGSSSFTRLVNLPFQERYVQPLLPLVAVGGALLFKLEEAGTRMRWIAITTVLISSVPSAASGIGRAGDRFFEGYLASAAVAVRSMEEPYWSPVFVDARTYAGLEHLIESTLLQRLKRMPDGLSNAPAGSYLLHPANPCSHSGADCGRLASARTVLRIRQPHRWLGYARPSTRSAIVRRID
jgi:hypothetical protein